MIRSLKLHHYYQFTIQQNYQDELQGTAMHFFNISGKSSYQRYHMLYDNPHHMGLHS